MTTQSFIDTVMTFNWSYDGQNITDPSGIILRKAIRESEGIAGELPLQVNLSIIYGDRNIIGWGAENNEDNKLLLRAYSVIEARAKNDWHKEIDEVSKLVKSIFS